MCKFSSKSGGVPFQPLGDLTWNDPWVEFFTIMVSWQQGRIKGGGGSTTPPPLNFFGGKSEEKVQRK